MVVVFSVVMEFTIMPVAQELFKLSYSKDTIPHWNLVVNILIILYTLYDNFLILVSLVTYWYREIFP